jgi:hypothetical protein
MAESPKRTERVHCNLTEREALDFARLANADNRTLSDMLYVVLRRYMYGRCAQQGGPVTQSRGHSEALADGFGDSAFDPASL